MRFFFAVFLFFSFFAERAIGTNRPNRARLPATGALRGQVADPSGAAIPKATVVMTPATGFSHRRA